MKEGGMENNIGNKFSYLRPDIKPIMTCIGDNEDHADSEPEDMKLADSTYMLLQKEKDSEFINWEAGQKELDSKGFKNLGQGTYVMSNIDSKDKFSMGYFNCTGIVATGEDKKTEKNISFLTHQAPNVFLHDKEAKEIFTKDLEEHFDDLKKK